MLNNINFGQWVFRLNVILRKTRSEPLRKALYKPFIFKVSKANIFLRKELIKQHFTNNTLITLKQIHYYY